MSVSAPKRMYDGFSGLDRGVDSGRNPSQLMPNQIAFGINTTVRGGYITHRPGYLRNSLRFLDANGAVDATLQERFEEGYFQGAGYYRSMSSQGMLVASISGRQFVIKVGRRHGPNRVQEITVNGTDVNNPTREKAWFCQAEDFIVIQDGQGSPIIYNGAVARRAGVGEVPTGTRMAYGLGRLWVSNGREFVAGDIVGGPTGSAVYQHRDAVLKFTENDYLNEGGSFKMDEEITAMWFPANLDTSLGQGDLMVGTRGGVASVSIPTDRTQWKNLNIPVRKYSLRPYGPVSQESVAGVNADSFFRSPDGIRSFAMAQRQFGQWGNVPVSREMRRVLDEDDARYQENCSAVQFQNRLLVTCNPLRDVDHGIYHRGLIALDFDLNSGMFEQLPPAYDGLWTGLNILQVVKGEFHGVDRCFAFVLSADGIELWEVTESGNWDQPEIETRNRITWTSELRSFQFTDQAQALKLLEGIELWATELKVAVDFTVRYRPDKYPLWSDWHSWSENAAFGICEPPGCTIPAVKLPQHRSRMGAPIPADSCETTNDRSMRVGYEFQVRLEVTGSCKLPMGRVYAMPVDENLYAQRCGDQTQKTLTGCLDDLFTYESNP